MIHWFEKLFRTIRRRLSRSEWAVPLLGLPVSEGTGSEPGLVLVQIDGLSRHQMERAVEQGRMPFLRYLMQRQHYELRTLYAGLPSSTPAVQGELYYGVRCAVPAFSFLDRSSRRVNAMFNPECAKAVEARLAEGTEGLLKGGSSWSNIYTGGAAIEESHFCAASFGLGNVFRSRPVVEALTFPLLHLPSVVRIVVLVLLEFFIALGDMIKGLFRGERFGREIKMFFSRVLVCVALREVMSIGAKIDVARGLPIIHLNFLGYDEQAHRRGPSSAFAHWSLLGIDRTIKSIYRAAQRSARRDYQVWMFSDHGQERTHYFGGHGQGDIEQVIHEVLKDFDGAKDRRTRRSQERLSRACLAGGKRVRRVVEEWSRTESLTEAEEEWFTVAAMGPVGHLYLMQPRARRRKREVAERLVRDGRVPGVLVREESGKIEWLHAEGSFVVPDEAFAALPHPAALKA